MCCAHVCLIYDEHTHSLFQFTYTNYKHIYLKVDEWTAALMNMQIVVNNILFEEKRTQKREWVSKSKRKKERKPPEKERKRFSSP